MSTTFSTITTHGTPRETYRIDTLRASFSFTDTVWTSMEDPAAAEGTITSPATSPLACSICCRTDSLCTACVAHARFATDANLDLHESAATLAPFADRPRVVIFGSARLSAHSPVYTSVRDLASNLAEDGFVVITGGGPGLMSAGLEGAGPGNAVGISVELPFESPARIDSVPIITQRRFFTRKLAMVRSTRAIIVAPGGFGTLDELFESLTLVQTGKKDPTPIVVMADTSSRFSDHIAATVEGLLEEGFISPDDTSLISYASSSHHARTIVREFWSRYRGWSLSHTTATLDLLAPESCAPHDLANYLETVYPDNAPFTVSAPDTRSPSALQVSFRFNRRAFGTLRKIIDSCNQFPEINYSPTPPSR